MQCDRLLQMIKSWYIHVREETMAPARMVAFIEQHAENCDVCLQDPELPGEISKITELVLPESKIPKAVRQQNTKLKEAEAKAEAEANEAKVDDGDVADDDDDDENGVAEEKVDNGLKVVPSDK